MRYLLLMHEGNPFAIDTFAGPLRKIILEHSDDDADLWSVMEVPPAESMTPSIEITELFAMTWAMELSFGDGIEPHDYLAPFPAFIREAARLPLIRKWEAMVAQSESGFLPNPVRKVA